MLAAGQAFSRGPDGRLGHDLVQIDSVFLACAMSNSRVCRKIPDRRSQKACWLRRMPPVAPKLLLGRPHAAPTDKRTPFAPAVAVVVDPE